MYFISEKISSRQIKRRISRGRNEKFIPIVTNTTLNVMRVIGEFKLSKKLMMISPG